VRFGLISAWVTNQQSLINEAKSSLLQSSERYRQAYQPYAAAVRAARREAQNQQQWMGIFIGIGIGVSVGLLAEALLPEAATLAAEAAAEVGAEVVEAGAGAAAHNLLPQIAGQNLEPGGLDPNVLELDVWRTLERLYHDLTSIVPFGNSLFLINGGAEYAIGEIRAHVAGGQTDMSEEQLLDLVQSLIRADRSGAAVEREVRSRLERLPDVLSRIRAAAAGLPSVEQMEKDIWVLWISEISESDSDRSGRDRGSPGRDRRDRSE